jgi:hypothetical protein
MHLSRRDWYAIHEQLRGLRQKIDLQLSHEA